MLLLYKYFAWFVADELYVLLTTERLPKDQDWKKGTKTDEISFK